MTVSIAGLDISIGGRNILSEVEMRLTPASVSGLIGRNGAGKSTLLKAIVGIVTPTRGSIQFDDKGPARVGYLPEHLGFVEHLSGLRNLSLLRSVRGDAVEVDLQELLERVGLDPRDRRPTSAYSQGMRRRLGIAQVVMDSPEVAVFDEPTNGLDPDGIRWFREMSRDLANEGVTVVISSHLLGELELSCDYLLVLRDGELVFSGTRQEMEGYAFRLRVLVEDEPSLDVLGQLFPIGRKGSHEAVVDVDCPPADAIRRMVEEGVRVRSVGPAATALEDLYVRLTR